MTCRYTRGAPEQPSDILMFEGTFGGCTEREIKVTLAVAEDRHRTVILPIAHVDFDLHTETRTAQVGVPRWLAAQAGLLL